MNSDRDTDLRSDLNLSNGVDDLHTHLDTIEGVPDLPGYTDLREDASCGPYLM
jgi:hypothetical protein